MALVNAIVKALEGGSIRPVLVFSDTDKMPNPPFIVVKPESGAIPDTRQYRIIIHHVIGALDKLEAYALEEIEKLLPRVIKDEEGIRYKLYKGGMTDITAEPDKSTYFMERIYYTPMLGIY